MDHLSSSHIIRMRVVLRDGGHHEHSLAMDMLPRSEILPFPSDK